jgi:hypothetical protein
MNRSQLFLVGALAMFLAACGGKGSFSGSSGNPIAGPAANVVTAVVNGGPNSNSANTMYTTVTICAPGSTTNCQTIDNIEIDTGSSGLRILAAALTANLPIQTDSSGNALAECTQFVDGYSWGPIALANLTISQETAQNLPVQVIGDPNFATVPTACANTGPAEDTVAAFGANGILGVATPAQDCGSACTVPNTLGFYYSCASATNCAPAAVTLGNQVQNPVTFFPTDNNGVIIELPSVAAAGAASATGALVFGIDTQSNNASGSGTRLGLQTTTGYLSVSVNGSVNNESFLDTGSNGIYFTDSSLPQCTTAGLTAFYCPGSTQNFAATVCAYNNSDSCSGAAQTSINFSIGNAESLFSGNASYTVFPTLGGIFGSNPTTVDLGLPFFFGRNVYEAFEGKSTSAGTGPYVSF